MMRSTDARRRWTLALAPTLAGLLAAGCAEDTQTGGLSISYRLGERSLSCTEDGVQMIRVSLDDALEEVDMCDTSVEFTLTDIRAQTYRQLLVEGLDDEMRAIRDNLLREDMPMAVEVLGGRVRDVDVTLRATPAQVRFTFAVVKSDGIQYAPREDIPIRAFRASAAAENGVVSLITPHEFVVDQLSSFSDVRLPDPERSIKGSQVDTVAVDVLTEDPTRESRLEFEFDPPGAGHTIDILVSCRGQACTGELRNPRPDDGSASEDDGGSDGDDETGSGSSSTGGDGDSDTGGSGSDTTGTESDTDTE